MSTTHGARARPFGTTNERPTTTYSVFVDDSARLTAEDIATFPGPISEMSEVASEEGDHDHLRVLVEANLAVVERVPEQFLERITAQRVFAKQPGPWG